MVKAFQSFYTNLLEDIIDILHLGRSYTAISFAASNLGYVASFAPDSKKASEAGEKIFELINRQPSLLPDEGAFPEKPFKGEVAFQNLSFNYPTRNKTKVLQVNIQFDGLAFL